MDYATAPAAEIDVVEIDLAAGAFASLWQRSTGLRADVGTALDTKAHRQLGTLGGGNHFIEACLDDDERVWLTLHSGSRNIGKELAERHISVAKELPHNADLPDRDLAGVVDEIPGAYKDLESVIAAQSDLVEVVAGLRTVLCVKG